METTVPFITYAIQGANHLRVSLPPLLPGVNRIETTKIAWHSNAGGDYSLGAEVFLNSDGTVSHWAELQGRWEQKAIRTDHLADFLDSPNSPYSAEYALLTSTPAIKHYS